MKVAIVGSRRITAYDLSAVIPPETTHIISGGARGVDTLARDYAKTHELPCTIILPDYHRYGQGAPMRRNDEIIALADLVIAIWDGHSHGTRYVIEQCSRLCKPVCIHKI